MSYDKITSILLTILIILVSISLFLQIKQLDIIDIKIKSAISEYKPKIPKDGYTPVKGIDYFDGKDGKDGKNATSTHTVETIIREVPVHGKDGANGKDGITPHIRCNAAKNRFEVSYDNLVSFQVMKDDTGNSVKCVIEE